MKVPFLDFKKEWEIFGKDFVEAFEKFGKGGYYVLGPEVEEFEQKFAEYCGYQYAVGVSSGLAALEVALLSKGVGPGDEVITVSNSAVATALSISNVGAEPVFCDIGDDFLIDTNKIENLITEKTKAILPVHLFGKICNMEKINEIVQKHGLEIIEDACQAHGSKFEGESLKNIKAFSFYPTKNLGALGEAGIILTNSEKERDFALSYRNYGQEKRYHHTIKGNNYRIDALQCVFLNIKLKNLDNSVKIRKNIAQLYIEKLQTLEDLNINDFDSTSSYHLFVIRVLNNKRDQLKSFLEENGITTLVHYPLLIHKQPCYKDKYDTCLLEMSDKFQDEILSLPCHPLFTKEEQNYTIEKIKEFFN